MNVKSLDVCTLKVLWAAMAAMELDVHAPQDNLKTEELVRSRELWKSLNDEINSRD